MNNRKYIRVYNLSERTSQYIDVSQQLQQNLDIKSYIQNKLMVQDDLELHQQNQSIWIIKKKRSIFTDENVRKVTFKNLIPNADNTIEERIIEDMAVFEPIEIQLINKNNLQFSERQQIDMFDKDKYQLFIYYKEQLLVNDGTCYDYDIQSGSVIDYIIAKKYQDQYCFYLQVNNTPNKLTNLLENTQYIFTHANSNENLDILLQKLINKYKISNQHNIYFNHQKLNLQQTLIQLGLMNGIHLHCEIPAKFYDYKSIMYIELCFKYNEFYRQMIVPLDRIIDVFLHDIKREMLIEHLNIELHQNGKPLVFTESLLKQNILYEYMIIISEKVQINKFNNLSIPSMVQDMQFNKQEEYYPGLSILFTCINQECVKKGRQLIYNLEFGTFFEQNLESKIQCEQCGKNKIFHNSFQVFKCKFKISNKIEMETIEVKKIGLHWKEIMCAPLQQ